MREVTWWSIVVERELFMRLFRFQNARYLAPLWTVILVLGLITFAARAPLARFHDSASSRLRSSAVLAILDG